MNLIIHYELENFDLMDYEYKSLKRYLTKKDKLYEYENLIINSLIKLPGINDKSKRIFQLEILKNEINSLLKMNENSDKKALDYFDIISWIDSRIHSKKFSDIIKSNSKIKLSDLNF